MIISMHAENAFDKIQYLFLIQALICLGPEENMLSLRRGVQKRLTEQAWASQTAHSQEKACFHDCPLLNSKELNSWNWLLNEYNCMFAIFIHAFSVSR